ncbi:MAG TPA: nucleoside monophosphate kinase [Acidimicrobiia bacterium]
MRLVVLGRQGAGKGTQCARLARTLGVAHVATGDLFRSAMTAQTDLGRRVKAFVDTGELVPDELAVAVVADRLTRDDARERGFVLDGFPRTVCQARELDALLAPLRIDLALDLHVDRAIVLRRLLRRRVCADCGNIESVTAESRTPESAPGAGDPGNTGDLCARCHQCGGALVRRTDDTEPVIRRRLALYESQTRPLLSWFETDGKLATVDGHGSPDAVALRVELAIATRPARAPEDARIVSDVRP